MAKYKDADKLLKQLNSCKYPTEKTTRRQATYNAAINDARKIVDALPAADVAEVVRCKECRYREKEQPGMVYCPNIVGGWVGENWFCKAGEKE